MPTAWEIAKEKLTKEIVDGNLPHDIHPKAVRQLDDSYKNVPEQNFEQNLNELRKRLANFKFYSELDDKALRSDRLYYPEKAENRWAGSEAERLLKIDIDDGRHERMKPKELYEDPNRVAYKEFSLDQFRKHINQEVRSRKGTMYWMALKAQKKEAKAEKKEKKEKKKQLMEQLRMAGIYGTTVPELKDECRKRGLKVSGNKADIINRLLEKTSNE